MKIDFSQHMFVDGKPVESEGGALMLGAACRIALNAGVRDDRALDVETMVRKGRLAAKVAACEPEDLAPEDVTLIRGCLPNAFQNAEFVSIVYDMLG